jgi:diguanylate cyclase (GGDEF)-like protein
MIGGFYLTKKYQFEEIRLYAILSFIFMSLIYSGISFFYIPLHNPDHNHFPFILKNFVFFAIWNLVRYRYFNTVKYSENWVFLLYGCIDLCTVSFYFGVPTLDQGGKIVVLFILIMASIYRGRKIGLILTLIWFPMKIASDFIFMNLLKDPGGPDFHKMMISEHIIDALYFQIMLLILVFITEVIYREIADKEKHNNRLLHEIADQYKELTDAHDEIEAKNDRLKKANVELEDANKKLTHRFAELFTVQQVSKAISSLLDINELMNYVNDITLGVMGVKNSTIILFNEKISKLEVHTTNITDGKAYTTLCNNVNCSQLLSILAGEIAICDNNVDSNRFIFTEDRDVKSLICVPIISKLKKFGLILIEQDFKNAFDVDKVKLLTVIAQQVGMAMENADLYHKMHQLAVRDNLTGAYNRLYFNERLEEELINAQNECYELAIAMFDIDYFKKFNDTYGHLFGDKVLKTVAEVINQSIRSKDVMARFGGEEFIILFPHTSLTKAYKIVERLRKKIECTNIMDDSVCASVTASFGIASFPQNSSNIMELLKNVDDALYKAKDSGRNCVKISEKTKS